MLRRVYELSRSVKWPRRSSSVTKTVTDEDLHGRNILPFSLYRYVKVHKLSSSLNYVCCMYINLWQCVRGTFSDTVCCWAWQLLFRYVCNAIHEVSCFARVCRLVAMVRCVRRCAHLCGCCHVSNSACYLPWPCALSPLLVCCPLLHYTLGYKSHKMMQNFRPPFIPPLSWRSTLNSN